MSTTRYNLKNIRTLLTEGFTAEELRRLCFDISDFRAVYDQLTGDTGKDRIIDLLLEHAERRLLLEYLLVLVKEQNPSRYENYQPYTTLTKRRISLLRPRLSLRDFRHWLLGD